jgi:hypothetical protein
MHKPEQVGLQASSKKRLNHGLPRSYDGKVKRRMLPVKMIARGAAKRSDLRMARREALLMHRVEGDICRQGILTEP